jgi:hypothetical protein
VSETTVRELPDVTQLGDVVIDALEAAGMSVRDRFGDGYDVLSAAGGPLHVAVQDVREGALAGMGGWAQMNAQRLAVYDRVLVGAGLATRLLKRGDDPIALLVAHDDAAADAALTWAELNALGGVQ